MRKPELTEVTWLAKAGKKTRETGLTPCPVFYQDTGCLFQAGPHNSTTAHWPPGEVLSISRTNTLFR